MISYGNFKKGYEVLKLLSDGLNPYQIAKTLNLNISTIKGRKGHLRGLEKKGLVKKEDSNWSVTKEGFKVLHEGRMTPPIPNILPNDPPQRPPPMCEVNTKVRGHAFQFTLSIPAHVHRNDFREVIKDRVKAKVLGRGQLRIVHRGFKVWLCSRSIVVWFPAGRSYFDGCAGGCLETALKDFRDVVNELEVKLGFLKFNFAKDRRYKFRTTKCHFALVKNELARLYNGRGEGLKVFDDRGNLWLLADDSFNLDELEGVSAKTGVRDVDDVVVPFFNDLRDKSPPLPSKLADKISELEVGVGKVVGSVSELAGGFGKMAEGQDKLMRVVMGVQVVQKKLVERVFRDE